jgi:hypothetical protein
MTMTGTTGDNDRFATATSAEVRTAPPQDVTSGTAHHKLITVTAFDNMASTSLHVMSGKHFILNIVIDNV